MSRLIDADALIEEIGKIEIEPYYQHEGEDWAVGLAFASGIISEAETIDAVPVVRCRECKHRKKLRYDGKYHCLNADAGMATGVELNDNDFCSYGEQKGGADNEP